MIAEWLLVMAYTAMPANSQGLRVQEIGVARAVRGKSLALSWRKAKSSRKRPRLFGGRHYYVGALKGLRRSITAPKVLFGDVAVGLATRKAQ